MFDDLQTTPPPVNPPIAPLPPPPATPQSSPFPSSPVPPSPVNSSSPDHPSLASVNPSPQFPVPSPKAVEDIFDNIDKDTPPAQPAIASSAQNSLPPLATASTGSNKTILIIVIVAVLVLILGGGGFFAWKMLNANDAVKPLDNSARQAAPLTDEELGKAKGNVMPPVVVEPAPAVVTVDSDSDGLPDSEEITLGTNPNKADTDSDGLFDYDEAKVYKTDPLNPDTDGDSYKDGDEVNKGFDPKGPGKLLNFQTELQKLGR